MEKHALERSKPAPDVRPCDYPACSAAGEYRAPKSRRTVDGYYWFCLEHVRQYNSSWNYFEGMTDAEIERYQRDSIIGHRPTWRFGTRSGDTGFGDVFNDAGGIFGPDVGPFGAAGQPAPACRAPKPGEKLALAQLDLHWPATLKEVKERYKELVKRHHPDANGGDRKSEERLKKVNQAYTFLHSCDLG